jgi:hypothetical protein
VTLSSSSIGDHFTIRYLYLCQIQYGLLEDDDMNEKTKLLLIHYCRKIPSIAQLVERLTVVEHSYLNRMFLRNQMATGSIPVARIIIFFLCKNFELNNVWGIFSILTSMKRKIIRAQNQETLSG